MRNSWKCVLLFLATALAAQDTERVIFGTTVVIPSGLRGEIYYLHHNSRQLPDFKRHKAVGTIYATSLNVPPQEFDRGFPGVTKRLEWFAIDYTGRFWIQRPGEYTFSLTSDDGSKLYLDGSMVIDNDGVHPPETRTAAVNLEGGIHNLRVSYFQGPRYHVALILQVAGPGEPLRIFSTDEFKPPSDPSTWIYGEKK